jgi:hypothetical protein
MKFFFLLIIVTLSFCTWAQEESDEIIETPVAAEEISPKKSAEVMESLRKTQKSREEQNKFLEELEISE